jgi:hypothetical protein
VKRDSVGVCLSGYHEQGVFAKSSYPFGIRTLGRHDDNLGFLIRQDWKTHTPPRTFSFPPLAEPFPTTPHIVIGSRHKQASKESNEAEKSYL